MQKNSRKEEQAMRLNLHAPMIWGYRHSGMVIFILLALTVFFACFISTVTKEMSARMLWIKDDPAQTLYEETVELFGSNRITVIFVKDKRIFTPDLLKRLSTLHKELEKIQRVERVDS
ncbi:MAG: hypothetical protein D3923_00005, partial [Candidatus Electrothrix sp. AR3]|nr:hypothetical protein [Candidatus Electrothrix sp. AR3]